MLDVLLRALCAPTLKLSPAAVASGEGLGSTKSVKDVGSLLPESQKNLELSPFDENKHPSPAFGWSK